MIDTRTNRDKAAFYANEMDAKAEALNLFIASGEPHSDESLALALALIADEALCEYYNLLARHDRRRA